jgi:hypothetical protein
MMNVYKVELMILNFDGLSDDELCEVIENTNYPNDCISPHIINIESREIGEWNDNHPLNKTGREQAFKELFLG